LEVVAALGLGDPLLDAGDPFPELLGLLLLGLRCGESLPERGRVLVLEPRFVTGRAGEAVEGVAATQLGVGEAPGRGAELGEAAAPVADGGLVVGAEVEACEELPALSLEFGDLPFAVGQATSGVGGVVACLLVCAGRVLPLRDGAGEVSDGGAAAAPGGPAGAVLGPRVTASR